MSTLKTTQAPKDTDKIRADWIAAVTDLVAQVEGWCKEEDWPTRRAIKTLDEPPIGKYGVPMLLIQNLDVRLLLEPVSRFVAGGDGLVDLYRMPAYDDIASIFWRRGKWYIHYWPSNGKVPATPLDAKPRLFTKAQFVRAVQSMIGEDAEA